MSDSKTADSRRILIVEDEPLIAWSLAELLRTLGYEVCATVATEGAAVAEAAGCDAILMDYRLVGGGSGLAAARKIRETANMPIVFCTAHAEEPGLSDEMRAVPRTALIAKPISRTKLEQALAQLFAR
jgi:CheY-like chemotaxis protein